MTGRENDARAKKLRAWLRAKGMDCHICGQPVDYTADHLDPLSFQLDHKWQVANGGPPYDRDNVASSHRRCNRLRSDTVDQIAIDTAASYGHTLTHKNNDSANGSAQDGQPGVTFITHRNWWDTPKTANR